VNENERTLDDYLAILKRRRWQLAIPALVLALMAALLALLLPPVYRSSATILIEQQEIPPDLVRSTVMGYADQRIQIISQRVMTTASLSQIIERHGLYPELRAKRSMNEAVKALREAISIEMISAELEAKGKRAGPTIAFSLSYEGASPGLAQEVTNDLVSLFLSENIEQRRAAATETTEFLAAEAGKLNEEIASFEAQLADFKEAHSDNLPQFAEVNREWMNRTEERLRDNAQSIQTTGEQLIYLESELSQLSPYMASSPAARLQELETQYPGIAARYSPTHPDRVQIEKEIAALRSVLGAPDAASIELRLASLNVQLKTLKERYSDNHPDVVALKRGIADSQRELDQARRSLGSQRARSTRPPDNPAFVQLRARYETARLEMDKLKQTRAELEEDLKKFESRIMAAPRVEQEYSMLMRDYENARARYKEIKEKESQAALAKSLEADLKGERFTLIEPPILPEQPYKPNRPAILGLGLIASVAGGVGSVALREILDKGLHGARAVLANTGAPPLASIPYIATAADRRRRVLRVVGWLVAILGSLAGAALAMHFFVVPLDILWFKLLERIDLVLLSFGFPTS
jgi:uncharacterized protein involved in exopolysaccharide biosynthesis